MVIFFRFGMGDRWRKRWRRWKKYSNPTQNYRTLLDRMEGEGWVDKNAALRGWVLWAFDVNWYPSLLERSSERQAKPGPSSRGKSLLRNLWKSLRGFKNLVRLSKKSYWKVREIPYAKRGSESPLAPLDIICSFEDKTKHWLKFNQELWLLAIRRFRRASPLTYLRKYTLLRSRILILILISRHR